MTAKNKRASEPRRANKPLMEKRRRARINQSLAALKTLILDSAKADNTKHSKLEKADILELTVRHFQRHRSLDVKGVNQYKAGYADCVREVQRYLETPDAQTMTLIDAGVRQRLLRHLDSCVAEVDVDIRNHSSVAAAPLPVVEERLPANGTASTAVDAKILEEVNNNLNSTRLEAVGAETLTQQQHKLVKNYDGNFVLLLPEHYVQLANVLGVNLRSQQQQQQQGDDNNGEAGGSGTISATDNALMKDESGDESVPELKMSIEKEKPLDFSKNNENGGDNMWRPW